jgi:hypothetical protein
VGVGSLSGVPLGRLRQPLPSALAGRRRSVDRAGLGVEIVGAVRICRGEDHLGLVDLLVAGDGAYGGSDGEELDNIRSPEVKFLDELNADDSFGT